MADAWGGAWAVSWGVSWGSGTVTPAVATTRGGGIAHYGERDDWQLRRALREKAALEAAFAEEFQETVEAEDVSPPAPEVVVQAPANWPTLVPIAQQLLEIAREIERLERDEEEAAFMLLMA